MRHHRALSWLLPILLVATVGTPAAKGQLNARRDANFAVNASDEEHDHFVERYIPRSSGIYVEPVYYGELFTNTRGGIRTQDSTQYQGLFDLTLAIDFDRMGAPIPGKFAILGQTTHGRGLTLDFVGDSQTLSNIDTGANVVQVGEYWWELPLCDDCLTLRLGKQDLNTEFLVVEWGQDFIQSGFGISPALAVPTYPHASAAALVMANLTESLALKVGVWDGVPDGGNWGFSGTGITFTIGELEYEYALGDGQLPGQFQCGIAYRSAGEIEGVFEPQIWAWYTEWEQFVWRENPDQEDDEQGCGMFLQYGVGHDQSLVQFPEYLGAGIVYRGPWPGRDEDTVGLGVARARLNSGGTDCEVVTELFYRICLRPNVYFQPDLQYIASPSGIYPDALVVGARLETAF